MLRALMERCFPEQSGQAVPQHDNAPAVILNAVKELRWFVPHHDKALFLSP